MIFVYCAECWETKGVVIQMNNTDFENIVREQLEMREILFRGKQTDKDKWIYGVPFKGTSADESEILIIESVFECDEYACRGCEFTPVIPSTVGQYTGLTDKNGKKIFEGDIVKHYNHCRIKEYSEDIGRVFYYAETCRFLRTSKLFPNDCPEIFSGNEYEVIGNIHDNGDLLRRMRK